MTTYPEVPSVWREQPGLYGTARSPPLDHEHMHASGKAFCTIGVRCSEIKNQNAMLFQDRGPCCNENGTDTVPLRFGQCASSDHQSQWMLAAVTSR